MKTTLKDARIKARLPQMDLARRVNIHQPILSNYERGGVIPPENVRKRIESVLNQEIDWNNGTPELSKAEVSQMLRTLEIISNRIGYREALEMVVSMSPDTIRKLMASILPDTNNINIPHDFTIVKTNAFYKENLSKELKERNKMFLPLARKLAKTIQRVKNIKIPPKEVASWTSGFRLLNKKYGISIERIKNALKWYDKNIGKPYVPTIYCGISFKQKFTKLENAMQRDNKPTRDHYNIHPEQKEE